MSEIFRCLFENSSEILFSIHLSSTANNSAGKESRNTSVYI